jgi:proliferating cell nuclear antigen PCNA
MTIIWKAKANEAYSLKILIELLQTCIKTGSFIISSNGVKLRMMDYNKTILVDLNLDSDYFSVYKFKPSEPLNIGVNLTHFHKMLKPVKKKDSLQMFIDDTDNTDLGIKIIPKENNRVTTSFIKIQNIQNIDIDLPEGYGKPVIVPSTEFQKMCKGLTHISNVTRVTAKGFLVRFSSDAGGVMKRYTDFGEMADSDSDSDEKSDDADYNEDFDTEQLTKITKLSGLGATMQIYTKKDSPLLLRTTVGSLGKLSVYLKSKSLQEMESHAVEEDE